MKYFWRYLKALIAVAIIVALFGFIGPTLISYPDTLLVVLGFLCFPIAGPLLYLLFKKEIDNNV